MFSVSRLVRVGYVFGLSLPIALLLWPNLSRGQFRGSPTIFIPIASSSSASGGSSGSGFIGGAAGSSSGSTGSSITLAQIRMIGLPSPMFELPLTNLNSDNTGEAQILGKAPMGIGIPMPLGIGGMTAGGIGGGGLGGGGLGGGGLGGGGLGGGMGGGMGGMGGMGMGGGGMRGGGMGGFAGKGMGGFNGRKAL